MTPPPKPNAGELGGTICGSSSCCQYCEMLIRTWNFRIMSLIRSVACVFWVFQNVASSAESSGWASFFFARAYRNDWEPR